MRNRKKKEIERDGWMKERKKEAKDVIKGVKKIKKEELKNKKIK